MCVCECNREASTAPNKPNLKALKLVLWTEVMEDLKIHNVFKEHFADNKMKKKRNKTKIVESLVIDSALKQRNVKLNCIFFVSCGMRIEPNVI